MKTSEGGGEVGVCVGGGCGVKVTNSILFDNLFGFPSHRLAELIISQIYGHFVTLRIHDFFISCFNPTFM